MSVRSFALEQDVCHFGMPDQGVAGASRAVYPMVNTRWKLGIIVLTVWHLWLRYQINQCKSTFPGSHFCNNFPGLLDSYCWHQHKNGVWPLSTPGALQSLKPLWICVLCFLVLLMHRLEQSCRTLHLKGNEPASHTAQNRWQQQKLPELLSFGAHRSTTRRIEPSPALSARPAARKAHLYLHLKLRHGNRLSAKCRLQNQVSAWDACPPEPCVPLQKAVKQSVLPGGPQRAWTYPFQICLDQSIRCK